jgi:hypothetical protein
VNTDNLTIEDILDMSERERDRVVAEWLGEVYEDDLPPEKPKRPIHMYSKRGEKFLRWPHFTCSWSWKHAGRLLEALPMEFKRSPGNWFYDRMGQGIPYTGHEILSKKSIVLAACICAVRGVEPRGGE